MVHKIKLRVVVCLSCSIYSELRNLMEIAAIFDSALTQARAGDSK